jgi:ATP-binding cassette, subfamily F, member 3
MIAIQNIRKGYGLQTLLEDTGFQVNEGERIGISGRNGHGKSTLFRMILGQESTDGGRIEIPKGYTIGHLEQHYQYTQPTTLAEACEALPLIEGMYREEYKAEEILDGLGFSKELQEKDPHKLSGGFQVRLNLAKALLREPRMLLLDEPTNYLDITSSRWLERFLKTWDGELMIITHDRAFMDAVCTHVVGIHRRKMRKVQGTVQKMWETIYADEDVIVKTYENEVKRRAEMENFIRRFRAQAAKAKMVQSRVKLLEKQGELQTLAPAAQDLDFKFTATDFPGKRVLQINNLSFRYNADAPLLIDNLSLEVFKGDRIAIIGPNGRGKTTLLNLIANELESSAGSIDINPNVKMAYFGQTNVQRLDVDLTVEEEILVTLNQAKNNNRGYARSLAGLMMFEGDNALKRIKVLSGGERSRVLLAKILATPSNLLLLDEPTNHLDMESVESLVEACEQFSGTVLLVSHDEDLLRALATRLVVFDGDRTFVFDGTYDEFLERVGWVEEAALSK